MENIKTIVLNCKNFILELIDYVCHVIGNNPTRFLMVLMCLNGLNCWINGIVFACFIFCVAIYFVNRKWPRVVTYEERHKDHSSLRFG